MPLRTAIQIYARSAACTQAQRPRVHMLTCNPINFVGAERMKVRSPLNVAQPKEITDAGKQELDADRDHKKAENSRKSVYT